jgi:regulator of sirC expression with transglutaminase-like and TPR domain
MYDPDRRAFMFASHARERFTELVKSDAGEIDLLVASLLIAQEEYPECSVEECVETVENIADKLGRHVDANSGFHNIAYALSQLLFKELGFAGNAAHYDDPDNSMMNKVLSRRKGIPVTLCILTMEILRRGTGVSLYGVDFPGHFLLAFDDPEGGSLYLDPFHRGRLLLEEELARKLLMGARTTGKLEPGHLRRVGSRRILVRLLSNLKLLYARRRDVSRTLSVVERIVLLHPESAEERRDRGILYGLSGLRMAAIADLEDYLTMRPEARDADQIRRRLERLLRQGPI